SSLAKGACCRTYERGVGEHEPWSSVAVGRPAVNQSWVPHHQVARLTSDLDDANVDAVNSGSLRHESSDAVVARRELAGLRNHSERRASRVRTCADFSTSPAITSLCEPAMTSVPPPCAATGDR